MLLKIFAGAAFTLAACYSIGRLCLRRIPTPAVFALPVGAAIFSLLVYALALAGAAGPAAFGALGAAALLPLFWKNSRPGAPEKYEPLDPPTRMMLTAVLIPYGVFYAVNALAPEIQPDAVGYHLGLVSEYLRLGSFPDRVDFYGILPQGMEMLYLFAFAFGRHSAAKLVQFAFLIATVPVMLALGRRLNIADRISWIAAALYLCAPVVGVSGTSSYTDASLVCCTLSALYFLISWQQQRETRYLIPAGLLAGFCYAIKLSALMMLPLGAIFVLLAARWAWKPAALFAAAASIPVLPWMSRAYLLTGNPVAPLFNSWFPNPYFLVIVEHNLAKFLRTYEGFTFANAPLELTVGGASHGITGPLFLLAPVGLLALRKPAGRWLWIAAAALTLPWFVNVGTRFLMPALPLLAFALAMTLPRPVALAALAFHAISCWPAVIARYERPGLWRLTGFPWQAALRMTPERQYLRATIEDYQVAELIDQKATLPGKVLALTTLASAYLDREATQYWQSAIAVRLREELLEPLYAETFPLLDWTAHWPEQPLTALRFRLPADAQYEWEVHEAAVLRGAGRVPAEKDWRVVAWPNLFEAPFALDGSQASRWRSWEPSRDGMFFEIDFGAAEICSAASLTTHWTPSRMDVWGRDGTGAWRLLESNPKATPLPKEDLLKAAIGDLKRAGYGYVLTPTATGGNGPLGKYLLEHAQSAGIVEVGGVLDVKLLRL